MPLGLLEDVPFEFRTQTALLEPLRAACAASAAPAAFHMLGASEAGRPLYGVVLGRGPLAVSLLAGAHADEPIGPETLRSFLLEALRRPDALGDLLDRVRFVVVPHVNPDGEARNRAWMTQWPSLEAYLRLADREPPGRDLEFGFPAMRVENRAVAGFLRAHAPFALHMSLHGMGIAEGAMLLIERHWADRTQPLRDGFATAVTEAGLGLHDHNRKGEKGFFYIEPGFTTTPEGEAMRYYFRTRQHDPAMAARFHDSSMEYVRTLGGDPLCLVTELPLFLLRQDPAHPPGVPTAYLAFRQRLPEIRARLEAGRPAADLLAPFDPRPLDPALLVRLQLRTLALGLEAVLGEARV